MPQFALLPKEIDRSRAMAEEINNRRDGPENRVPFERTSDYWKARITQARTQLAEIQNDFDRVFPKLQARVKALSE